MAKRDSGGKQIRTTAVTSTANSTTGDAMEQLVMAFAEQLGRIAGTVQGKAEGWMDRDALTRQIAGVRDSAAQLLDQLAEGVTSISETAKKAATTAAAAKSKAASKGRSGGVVDAPGKKHRKPMPVDPRAVAADAKRANMRSSQASMKTTKTRGRG
jgi:uncharacterized phage infection (PIP) family protein YhgE